MRSGMTNWRIMIHGGAIEQGRERLSAIEAPARDGLQSALDAGSPVLRDGGSAIDAVEAAIRVLEEHVSFNAGRGGALSADGEVELDAAIMDGNGRRAGAVAALRTTRAPISAARRLMDQGKHVLVAGVGGDEFARSVGLEQVENGWFETPERRRQLEEMLATGHYDEECKYGTVGAVAVDSEGHVAAGTSTGGLMGKRWGRIGDAPLIGCGTYADDRSVAVSGTGSGEYFIRSVAGHQLGERIRLGGESLQQAIDSVLADVSAMGGRGGLIAVTPSGDAAWGFTTNAMYRGVADADGSQVAIYSDDEER